MQTCPKISESFESKNLNGEDKEIYNGYRSDCTSISLLMSTFSSGLQAGHLIKLCEKA